MQLTSALRPIGLSNVHIWIILFDIQDYWLRQLLGMSFSLAFIHLLDNERAREVSQSELEACCEEPLLDMFYRSPSKLHVLHDKCLDAIRLCQTATKYCNEWLITNGATEEGLKPNDIESCREEASSIDGINFYYACFCNSHKRLLASLYLLEQRGAILNQYQGILERVTSRRSCPGQFGWKPISSSSN